MSFAEERIRKAEEALSFAEERIRKAEETLSFAEERICKQGCLIVDRRRRRARSAWNVPA
ncbi:MAG: hypothetical protein NC400_08445 [Clostridium sp.]|nr:hypothetical protein [Clostridium sp.]